MSACRQATAGAGVIRAEVIDGAKLTRFTKWGRKYLPGTAWKDRTAGGKSPCGSTFSDHHMESLTFQLHLLDIEILQILRPLKSAAHEDKLLSSCLFFQAARSYIEMNRLG